MKASDRIFQWNGLAAMRRNFDAHLELDMIKEEVGELEDAIKKNDWKEYLDACADIITVTYGSLYKYGLSPEEVEGLLGNICNSNDSKRPFTFKENGKIAKGDTYREPSISDMTFNQGPVMNKRNTCVNRKVCKEPEPDSAPAFKGPVDEKDAKALDNSIQDAFDALGREDKRPDLILINGRRLDNLDAYNQAIFKGVVADDSPLTYRGIPVEKFDGTYPKDKVCIIIR